MGCLRDPLNEMRQGFFSVRKRRENGVSVKNDASWSPGR